MKRRVKKKRAARLQASINRTARRVRDRHCWASEIVATVKKPWFPYILPGFFVGASLLLTR